MAITLGKKASPIPIIQTQIRIFPDFFCKLTQITLFAAHGPHPDQFLPTLSPHRLVGHGHPLPSPLPGSWGTIPENELQKSLLPLRTSGVDGPVHTGSGGQRAKKTHEGNAHRPNSALGQAAMENPGFGLSAQPLSLSLCRRVAASV